MLAQLTTGSWSESEAVVAQAWRWRRGRKWEGNSIRRKPAQGRRAGSISATLGRRQLGLHNFTLQNCFYFSTAFPRFIWSLSLQIYTWNEFEVLLLTINLFTLQIWGAICMCYCAFFIYRVHLYTWKLLLTFFFLFFVYISWCVWDFFLTHFGLPRLRKFSGSAYAPHPPRG
jgi:hypothetical protein